MRVRSFPLWTYLKEAMTDYLEYQTTLRQQQEQLQSLWKFYKEVLTPLQLSLSSEKQNPKRLKKPVRGFQKSITTDAKIPYFTIF